MTKLPILFVSEGDPRLALDRERREDLGRWARDLPRPRAILVVSAHWSETTLTRGSTAARPRLVGHEDDPPGAAAYPAPGAPELAYELHALLPVERAERGWDRGVWGPLVHMYPDADVPVLQLSLVAGSTPRRLYALGRKIGVLAERGVLILASGAITRNATEAAADVDAPAAEWAREFDAWIANQLADSEMEELLAWRAAAPHARRAQEGASQLDPLFVAGGAASLYEHAVGFPIRGFEHGVFSRRCVQFGR